MLLILVLDIGKIESYLKKNQINLAIEELKTLRTEQEFLKAYYLFLKYNVDEGIVIKMARSILSNDEVMINEAFEYYYRKDDLNNAIYELSKSNDDNYIYYQLIRLYSSFGSEIYREFEKYKNDKVFRKAIFRFLLTDNKFEMALKYASTSADTIAVANSYYEDGNYNKVIELLKNKNDNFSKKLYGLSLYKVGDYENCAKILEKLEPEVSAECYIKIGDYYKSLKITSDTTKIISSLFDLKRYDDVIRYCQNDFYKECFLSYLYTQSPESVVAYFRRTFPKARNIDSDIALYIEVLNTYQGQTALNFFYILKGENKKLEDKDLENLAYAMYYERKNQMEKAKSYYSNVSKDSWIRPFALYKLYILTKLKNYKDELMENYPSSVYSSIVRDK